MYHAQTQRYDLMTYQRCGTSGLLLPRISLGLWHNFGGVTLYETALEMAKTAFDLGITHFDLANNYGPPPGSAEENFGRMLKNDFAPYRDELIISTKAGYRMGPGPYGEWGSRKYLLSSLDASLRRLGLDYVDIFYHHRPDPDTPLEETLAALDQAVRSGKALYVGLSNYSPEQSKKASAILKRLGTPCLIHQPRYSMFDRNAEKSGLLKVLAEEGIGSIVFSPLAKGLLSDRYLNGIPADSRAASSAVFLKPSDITEDVLNKVQKLNVLAQNRGQSLAQMALAWVLRPQGSLTDAQGKTVAIGVTTALIGASRSQQIRDNVAALNNLDFSSEELSKIETLLT